MSNPGKMLSTPHMRQITITRGFTLLEVLIALVVTSIGLLGVAKIQALSYASTSTAGLRSLMAMEAASLSAAMRANRGFWALPIHNSNNSIVITGNSVNVNSDADFIDVNAPNIGFCSAPNAACSPADMAANDLQAWANGLTALVPNLQPVTTITCTGAVVECAVSIQWQEKTVAANQQGNNVSANANIQTPTFSFVVEP